MLPMRNMDISISAYLQVAENELYIAALLSLWFCCSVARVCEPCGFSSQRPPPFFLSDFQGGLFVALAFMPASLDFSTKTQSGMTSKELHRDLHH